MKRFRAPGGRLRVWHIWLLALAASQLVQFPRSPREAFDPSRHQVELAEKTAAGSLPDGTVRVVYDDDGKGFPVVYLHGSPGQGRDGARLGRLVSREFRFLAPDLPGFSDSSHWIADYGLAAQARYVLEFCDRLGIPRAHFIAHSMGAGVAIELYRLAPERVASITLYGGIGIQEGEGSGDYHFEHFKYAAGYVALVALPELIPHFGLLGPRWARHTLIRNFWDSDQRSLRGILAGLRAPLLILHGRKDPLVPVRVAEEHHRIVPHSELVILDASHFLVFSESGSERLAGEILPFLARAGAPGAVAARRTVDESGGSTPPTRLPRVLRLAGIGPWFQVPLLALATLVSEDLTCISAGLLARDLALDPFVAVVGCAVGIFVGDIGLWFLGRVLGRRILGWPLFARRVRAADLERFGATFDRHLGKTVMLSRFLPGTRVPVYVSAGIASRRPLAFTLWLFVAAWVWTPVLVVLAMLFGPAVARPFERLLGIGWIAWLAAALALLAALRVVALSLTRSGRRRLAVGFSKIWRWEFWPTWLFYLPLVPGLSVLALRYRGLTVPTAANPAMPHGGVVGESKHAILERLPAEWIVPSQLVLPGEAEARLLTLEAHVQRSGWSFPLILKPDEGQRGAGLKLARDRDDVRAYFLSHPRSVLVQTYDPGPHEAGVFYYRLPEQERGHVFSITDKRFPEVTGDGAATLEDLILADPRLRMQAGVFTRRHRERLGWVPGAGERVRLAVAGNHCQGTMFLDGSHLATADLEARIDAVARSFEGFYFGRFDLRYADPAEFRAGRGFRIVELNGVTSESTNVYDPSFHLWSAYRTLYRQWQLAFQIGAANRARGVPVSSLRALIVEGYRHYHGAPAELPAD